MKRLALTTLFLLAACAPAVQPASPPVTVTPTPIPAPPPSSPTPAPVLLYVVDNSLIDVSATETELTLSYSPGAPDFWFRLLLPNGRVSPVTVGQFCECLGVGKLAPLTLRVNYASGLRVETAPTTAGPWTLAARTP